MWTSPSLLLPSSFPISPTASRRRRRRLISAASLDPLTSIGRLLWGRSLPPSLLISTVRSTWSATWHLFMRQLAPSSPSGSYSRPPSLFPAVPPHYLTHQSLPFHLFAALPCPWAHRTLIVRALKNLETDIPVSVATAGVDGGWVLDNVMGKGTVREVYRMMEGGYDGRATVPMLWDVDKGVVVCNESYGIVEFFNERGGGVDLAPEGLKGEIQRWNEVVYPNVNNGVYRCGFAQSQDAYDSAVSQLFNTLDMLDSHLATSRYLCGDVLTLADVCLFTTLIRFDLVYNVLFKCTKKKLVEYPNLYGYTREIYQIPKVAETCDFEAIKGGYYGILFPLNPGSIQPVTPSVSEHESLSKPHNRELVSLKENHQRLAAA